jgi:5-(carboxyamino)imidazole ribonucleotide mutase
MPRGIPVATVAIGKSGAVNAALLAAAILAIKHSTIAAALERYRAKQTADVLEQPDPRNAR